MIGLYRIALRLLPRPLRARFGAEMEADFRRRLEHAEGPIARGRLTLGAVADVLTQSLTTRMTTMRTTGLGRDLRWSLRSLRRAPGFSLAAVTTLALAIGATSAVYGAVRALLLEPLPWADAERLVAPWPEVNANGAMVRRFADDVPAFQAVSGISHWSFTLTGDGPPEQLQVALVTANHFDLLGVRPLLGRTFVEGEDLPGRGGVAVLSHGLWVSRFGADPEIVGRTVALAGAEHDRRTVIGVMGEDFRPVLDRPRAWVPLEADPALSIADDDTWYVNYRVARLVPGATGDEAEAQLRALATRIQQEVPTILDRDDLASVTAPPIRTLETGEVAPVLWLLLGAVGLVLLLACANVANLFLARAASRERELGVVRALGASRGRVAVRVLAEAAFLGAAGVTGGLLLARGAVAALLRLAPDALPRPEAVQIGGGVLAFALLVTVGAVFLFGGIPALRASRTDATAGLATGTRSGARHGGGRLTGVLVAVQVALALMLATGAGLTVRSLATLAGEDPGFPVEGLATLGVSPPEARYGAADARIGYYREVVARLEAVPGVERAGGIQILPLTSSNWSFPSYPEGLEVGPDESPPSIAFRVVTPGYLEALGVPLLRGRTVEEADGPDAPKAVVVNRALAERYWPGEDPVGREIRIFSPEAGPMRIVGVVGDVRQFGVDRPPSPEMYIPVAQYAWGNIGLTMVARAAPDTDPESLLPALREAVWAVDDQVPVSDEAPMTRVLGRNLARARFLAVLLAAFGATALALGAVGVYGVTAFSVTRRLSEFGLRQALGASRRQVLRTAARTTAGPVVLGGVAGLAGVLLAGRAVAGVLHEVSPRDPVALAAAGVVLALTALLATLVPAWRATRMDPAAVLREE